MERFSLPVSHSSHFLQSYLSIHNLFDLNCSYIQPPSYRGSLLLMHKLASADVRLPMSFILQYVCSSSHIKVCWCEIKLPFENMYIVAFQFHEIIHTLRTFKIKIKEYYACCKTLFTCFSFLKTILNSVSSLISHITFPTSS